LIDEIVLKTPTPFPPLAAGRALSLAKGPGDVMIRFSEGQQVTIRYGKPQGKKAIIIQIQGADVYKVRVEDGSILYFSAKGLVEQEAPVRA
jgi:hypothetical protein